jgi:poly(3-hydroxybutyrate) depolymerase
MSKHPLLLITISLLVCSLHTVKSQTYTGTPQSERINGNCGGYYEFLPASYHQAQNGSRKFPLIVDVTGTGGQGNGSLTHLPRLLKSGIAFFMNNHSFPDSFSVNGKAYSFIVISPQFINRGKAADVKDVIEYVLAKYRVDTTRIYLTGFSNGGEPVWNYPCSGESAARQIAAMVPVAGVNTNVSHTGANFLAETNLPVWALHSTEDRADETAVENSINFVNAINSYQPAIPARLTLLTGSHVETWPKVFNPEIRYSVGGKTLSIYEWLLQYQRAPALPMEISAFTGVLFREDVQLAWLASHENNNHHFTINRSQDGVHFTEIATIPSKGNEQDHNTYNWKDDQPFNGINYYSLLYTDVDGKQVFFDTIRLNALSRTTAVRVFPTFVRREPIQILLNTLINSNLNVRIVDMNGRLIYRKKFTSQSEITLAAELLTTGMNVIEVSSDEVNKRIRVIKTN